MHIRVSGRVSGSEKVKVLKGMELYIFIWLILGLLFHSSPLLLMVSGEVCKLSPVVTEKNKKFGVF